MFLILKKNKKDKLKKTEFKFKSKNNLQNIN